jgi:type IV pilus assembly protein PilW
MDMKRDSMKRQSGFTLMEMMVSMAIASLIISATYQAFSAQQKSYTTQSYITEMQQNLRSGMYVMTKDIRSAGYNPSGNATVGFVTSFADPNHNFDINYATANNIIALTTDTDGDGVIAANNTEQIAYRFNATNRTLESFRSTNVAPGGVWEAVVDNVEAVNFVYLKGDGTSATLARDIRSVQIALLVRARQPEPKFLNTETYKNKQGNIICATCTGDHYRRRLLTTTVQARNLR